MNKKKQKNFDSPLGQRPPSHPRGINVFFASFLFTKKKTLPYLYISSIYLIDLYGHFTQKGHYPMLDESDIFELCLPQNLFDAVAQRGRILLTAADGPGTRPAQPGTMFAPRRCLLWQIEPPEIANTLLTRMVGG